MPKIMVQIEKNQKKIVASNFLVSWH